MSEIKIQKGEDYSLFFDLETGGKTPDTSDILTFAAQLIDMSTGKALEEFECKLFGDESRVSPEALAVNGINLRKHNSDPGTVSQGLGASIIFNFINRMKESYGTLFTTSYGKSFRSLAFGGYNVAVFDVPFLDVLFDNLNHETRVELEAYEEKIAKAEQQRIKLYLTKPKLKQVRWLLSQGFYCYDVQTDIIKLSDDGYFADKDLPNLKLSTVATHFGFDAKGAHDALADVKLSVELFFFLRDWRRENLIRNPIRRLSAQS